MATAYEMITKRILEKMEQGVIPWKKPWHCSLDENGLAICNGVTGRNYNLTNQFVLNALASADYTNCYYTWRQLQELGGKVKKGEHGNPVVFWKMWIKGMKEEPTDEQIAQAKLDGTLQPILKYYVVFNSAQIDDLPKSRYEIDKRQDDEDETDAVGQCDKAEMIIQNYVGNGGPRMDRDSRGDRACYAPYMDSVTIPKKSYFLEQPEYYSTVFHELGHSTGHKTRLKRDMSGMFGNDKYAREELIAELCAAFLCGDAGISCASQEENSAAYIKGWSKRISEDAKFFPNAVFAATKAAKWILEAGGYGAEEDDVTEDEVVRPATQVRQMSFL